MKDINVLIGEFLKQKRIEKGLTQESLGKRLKLKPNTICGYEKGNRKVDLETYYAICSALEISPNEISKYLKKNTSI